MEIEESITIIDKIDRGLEVNFLKSIFDAFTHSYFSALLDQSLKMFKKV